MCYPVLRMVHIKERLLLIGKSSPCSDGSGFPLSLSDPLPYVRCHTGIDLKPAAPQASVYTTGLCVALHGQVKPKIKLNARRLSSKLSVF